MTDEFQVVSDELRSKRVANIGISPATQALIDGKTILVPGDFKSGRYFNTLRRNGMRLRQHRTEEGMVLWAEKIEPADAE